ncbi:Phytanoyl-CoA dioxygenase [Ostreococcus tauri]|uniref:Phytanoyl-CoA dioxygenase n=1 Tax=Ostreococcus tauri TaxID=70448 RepID=Q018V0_OSTTA|nr:Phytanoyl-CoA dioxygenase [Ostreococcus tauri]CAL54075.1 Phytanoyl-CoA dioxygenase [Ostreococcus tauri]|eukprot:XP_003079417.1 Phytanoyl-CoA dioxygenase [Ostreococcus tauri]
MRARRALTGREKYARAATSRARAVERRVKTRVWRTLREDVSAVVDPRYDAVDDDGGLGPSSPDVQIANSLRLESAAQREGLERRGRRVDKAARARDARDVGAAAACAEDVRRDGATFLRGVCSEATCDAFLKEVHAVCDETRAEFGDALRRTDVKVGFDGAARAIVVEACGQGGVNAILNEIEDATSEAVMVEMSVLTTERGADRQVLHPDVSIDAPHAPLYSLFIALQDVVPEMGPTCFVLGTQDRASHDAFPNAKWGDAQFEALAGREWCDATLRKGDAVLYDARTFHQGGANEHGRRALMTLTFLKPPVPEAPTRRNSGAEWSIRRDVFDMRLTVGDIAKINP